MNSRNSDIEYRPIAGFPGYEVGADGSVWSCLVKGPQTEESRIGSRWKLMKPAIAGGYLGITLCVSGKRYSRHVHALVLEAFAGPRPKGRVARHFPDRDVLNCAITNLRWGTHKENAEDRDRDGNTRRGETNNKAKLTEADVRIIRAAMGRDACSRMARRLGVSRQTIHRIRVRKTWFHVL